MVNKRRSAALSEYHNIAELYNDFTSTLVNLLNRLLKEEGLTVHSITGRLKNAESFSRKYERGKKYDKATDITDLTGVRIITYFSDEVDAVAALVEREFKIDRDNSVDKRRLLDPDRFGYLSLHYVVEFAEARRRLLEYRRFSSCKAEIQIRSILQHAWAEIEHDLGYKSKQAVPQDDRRRFSRLAGLLEIADAEFSSLRQDLVEYEATVPTRIAENPNRVSVDKASIQAVVGENPEINVITQAIRELDLEVRPDNVDLTGRLPAGFNLLGITTIDALEQAVRESGETFRRFLRSYLVAEIEEGLVGVVDSLPLLLLSYFIAFQRGGEALLREVFKATQSADSLEDDVQSVKVAMQAATGID